MKDIEFKRILGILMANPNLRGVAIGGEMGRLTNKLIYHLVDFIVEIPETKLLKFYVKIEGYKGDISTLIKLVTKKFGTGSINQKIDAIDFEL